VKALQLLAVISTALLLGTTFAPVLEMPSELAMSGDSWSMVQRTVHRSLLAVGGPLENFTIVIHLAVLAAALSRPQLLLLTAGSTLSLMLAFAIWVAFTQPVHLQVLAWNDGAVPVDWQRWRDQWEFSQLIRFLLHLTGLLLLAASLLNLALDEDPESQLAHGWADRR
jgi:hypothetical protein